jgi:hypothetical protein
MPPYEKAHDAINNNQGRQSGENNRQVESPHSPLVRVHPADLSATRWNPSHRTDESAAFTSRFYQTAGPGYERQGILPEKQIYRRSWKP